jgi:hypothetical protein
MRITPLFTILVPHSSNGPMLTSWGRYPEHCLLHLEEIVRQPLRSTRRVVELRASDSAQSQTHKLVLSGNAEILVVKTQAMMSQGTAPEAPSSFLGHQRWINVR